MEQGLSVVLPTARLIRQHRTLGLAHHGTISMLDTHSPASTDPSAPFPALHLRWLGSRRGGGGHQRHLSTHELESAALRYSSTPTTCGPP